MPATEHPAEQMLHSVEERVMPQLEMARERLEDLNTQIVTFVRERPGTCLVGALAVGFVVGKLAARW